MIDENQPDTENQPKNLLLKGGRFLWKGFARSFKLLIMVFGGLITLILFDIVNKFVYGDYYGTTAISYILGFIFFIVDFIISIVQSIFAG